jgi:hypothetical protein
MGPVCSWYCLKCKEPHCEFCNKISFGFCFHCDKPVPEYREPITVTEMIELYGDAPDNRKPVKVEAAKFAMPPICRSCRVLNAKQLQSEWMKRARKCRCDEAGLSAAMVLPSTEECQWIPFAQAFPK